MSFDEELAKDFLKSEDSFDPDAAMGFLSEQDGKDEQYKAMSPLHQMLTDDSESIEPAGPKPQYTGLTKAIFGQEVPEPVKLAGEWGTAGTSSLLDIMGMPADAFNWALRAAGAEKQAWGGSQDLRNVGEDVGIAYSETPDTPAAKAGEYTALGLTFLAPVLGLTKASGVQALNMGKTVLPATSVPRGAAQTISAPFVTGGKGALATDVMASTGAGLGAYYGEQEFGQAGEIIGGIIGGFGGMVTGIVSPFVSRMLHKSGITSLAKGAGEKIPGVNKFVNSEENKRLLELGGRMKAGDRIRQLAETDDIAATITREQGKVLPQAKISPAKLSGDRHLIALENEILKTDPALAHKFILQDFETNKLVMKELADLGGDIPATMTQAHTRAKVNHVRELVNAKVNQALTKAQDSLTDISPMMRRRVVNTTVKANLDDALSKARAVEKEWWGKVRQDVEVPTVETRLSFRKIVDDIAESDDPKNVPGYLKTFLGFKDEKGTWGGSQTVKEMQALRSRILDDVRNEKSLEAPNWRKIRILDDTQEAILKDLAAAKQETGVEAAIQYSRTVNEKFKGGIMDQIFGHKKTGGKVAPELSVSSIKSGPKAAVEINKIITASPELKPVMEELVKLNIAQSKVINTKTGRVNVPMAKRYMLENEDVFDIFPELRKNMDNAIGLEERAIGTKESAKARLAAIENTTASKIANAKQKRIWTEIVDSPKPALAARKMVERSNDIGKRGLKSDAVDYLMHKKARTSAIDDDGVPILSGKKMKNEIKENRSLYQEIFSPDEMKRLDAIAETMTKAEGFSNLPDVGGVISPKQGVLSYAIVTLAARFGAKAGHGTSGASLRTASMASRAAQGFVDQLDTGQAIKLLKDSVYDPELYKAIYSDTSKPIEWNKAYKVLQGWMVAHAIESLEQE